MVTIALTFITTFSLCFTLMTILLYKERNRKIKIASDLAYSIQELQQIKLEKNDLLEKNDILQKQIFTYETKNQLLQQEKVNLEKDKQQWSIDKELIIHKISEEIIKKSHEQQNKISQIQEINIKKITQELFQNFENVTVKVASLNDQIEKSSHSIELTKQALLNPGGSGRAAEITLENILKNSGLKEKSNLQSLGDYILQSHFSNFNYSSNNEGKRPDAILFFPNDQVVIVDSKSSSHFLDLETARNEKDRIKEKEILNKIKDSFRKHLESLCKKDYAKLLFEDLFNKKSSNYKIMMIMFLQTEKMLDTLRQIEPDFEQKAMEKGIIVTSPIGLVNLLSQARIVIDRIKQEKNIEILKIEVKKLLDKISVIFKDCGDLGKSLNKALSYHDKITKSLNRGIHSSIEKISELGIDSKKSVNINKIEEFDIEPK